MFSAYGNLAINHIHHEHVILAYLYHRVRECYCIASRIPQEDK